MMNANFHPADTPRDTPPARDDLIAQNWPTLSRAIKLQSHTTAGTFSQLAYNAITAGIIRLDHRQRLARTAEQLNISPFDAQILIACAIRQWHLDNHHNPKPQPTQNKPQPPSPSKPMPPLTKAALLFTIAALLDLYIILNWLN